MTALELFDSKVNVPLITDISEAAYFRDIIRECLIAFESSEDATPEAMQKLVQVAVLMVFEVASDSSWLRDTLNAGLQMVYDGFLLWYNTHTAWN